jgi:hypothetical protein
LHGLELAFFGAETAPGTSSSLAAGERRPDPRSPLPTSPHHLRTQARATAGSALKMETGMARSLVGALSGLRGMSGE